MAKKPKNIKGNNICTYIMDTVKKSGRTDAENLELTFLSAYDALCGVLISSFICTVIYIVL